MQKSFLVSCALAVALTSYLPSRAMAQAPAPAQTSPKPSQIPSVSTEELSKFARAVKQMKQIDDAATQEIEKTVFGPLKKEGFTEARMNQIAEYKKDTNVKLSPPLTPKEEQTYDRAVAEFTRIQQNSMQKMSQVLIQEQIESQRFMQIFVAVRQDPALQQQVKSLMEQRETPVAPKP